MKLNYRWVSALLISTIAIHVWLFYFSGTASIDGFWFTLMVATSIVGVSVVQTVFFGMTLHAIFAPRRGRLCRMAFELLVISLLVSVVYHGSTVYRNYAKYMEDTKPFRTLPKT